MAEGFFFTDLDPRAAIKGSRDPLGAQAVWAALGRELVGNLTTVTQSVRGFTTLLVGLYLAERAAEADPSKAQVSAFLVWEQLAGYARCCFHGETSLLGSRRVVARTQRGEATLSADGDGQILGNQKSYGLWGLYTSAARTSGLVYETGPPRLTPEASALVEELYLPAVSKDWGRDAKALVETLLKGRSQLEIRKSNRRLRAIATMLRPDLAAEEIRFYCHYLVDGGPRDSTEGRQARLATTMRVTGTDSVHELASVAEPDVAARLGRIAAAESVLAPAAALFNYLLGRDAASLDDIARDVAATWGPRLDSVAPAAREVLQGSWSTIADGLTAGDYALTLQLLLDRNRAVMGERGSSAPWAVEGEDGKLVVRFRGDSDALPNHDDVRQLWRNPYFLPSLYSVTSSVAPRP